MSAGVGNEDPPRPIPSIPNNPSNVTASGGKPWGQRTKRRKEATVPLVDRLSGFGSRKFLVTAIGLTVKVAKPQIPAEDIMMLVAPYVGAEMMLDRKRNGRGI